MTMLQRLWIAALAAVACWLALPAPAEASPFCQAYANNTIQAYQRGRQLRCATFARANMNRGSHFNWCRVVPAAQANAALASTRAQLAACPQPQPAQARGDARFCGSYASGVIAAHNQGKSRGCPAFARANMNAGSHRNWCLAVPRQRAEDALRSLRASASTC
jgi:hypothetical protein